MATVTTPSSDALLREQALGTVARMLADRTGAEAVIISVEDEAGGLDHMRTGAGLDALLRDDARFVRRVTRSEGVLVERVPPRNGSGGIAFTVATPVQVMEEAVGAVTAGFRRPSSMSIDAIAWLIETHAAFAGLCLGDPSGARRVLAAAGTDALTGCHSHSHLSEALDQQVSRSRRTRRPLACAVVGFDDLGHADNLLGAPAGDQLLRLVGRTLEAAVRSCDILTRYGADEFALVLPEAPVERALEMAARLRERLEAVSAERIGSSLGTTIGVAEWTPAWSAGRLVREAVAARFDAKRAPARVAAAR